MCASDLADHQTVVYAADYPHYDDAGAMFNHATLVVQGRVIGAPRVAKLAENPQPDVSDPNLNPNAGAPAGAAGQPAAEPMVITVHAFEIAKVYKGSAKAGEIIEVKQLGGVLDGKTYKDTDVTPLKVGNSYTLFLETYPNSPASLLNPTQAQYPTDASGEVSALPGNPIKLSRSDLDRLAGAK